MRTLLFLLLLTSVALANPLLTLAIEGVQTGEGHLLIDWKLSCKGEKTGAKILEPSMERSTFGQTKVQVEAWTAHGRHLWELESPFVAGRYACRPDWFITVKPGAPAYGKVRVPLSAASFSPPLPSMEPSKAQVRLLHNPYDRSSSGDGWTGSLASPLCQDS